MRWWKVLGIAGIVGVAAAGTVAVRRRRKVGDYEPEEVRDRLRARLDAAEARTKSAR